jgi:hypothetical protein
LIAMNDWTIAALAASMLACAAVLVAQNSSPQSRAERTGFEETSRYDDVRGFLDALASTTPRIRVETFGKSEEGRALPLVVIGDPPAASPDAARASAKPIVLVMANIHAGEVEGKEALLHLARRMTVGDLQPLLPGAVWLFAPIYNADGNERISLDNRPEQYGPVAGVGTRENAQGLDLNRDFMKLESSEARALVQLFSRWDPHVVVDLHTTNGSYHGYHLTYSPTLNPNADPGVLAFARAQLLPAVSGAMGERHQLRTYYYGNFTTVEALEREHERPNAAAGTPAWRTFDHRPRFGNNYIGLRNRIAILSEAYSYVHFEDRVRATEAFVEEILRFVAANGDAVRRVTAEADRAAASIAGSPAGVGFRLQALPSPVEILVGDVEPKENPRSGRQMLAMAGSVAPTRMPDYAIFEATSTRRVPRAYFIRASPDRLHVTIASRLREHGITVEELAASRTVDVEQLVVTDTRVADRAFQGHQERSLSGRFERREIELPAGSIVVGTDQPLGRLVFYLLEPESDDGLTTWNVLDATLQAGSPHPVLKATP